MHAGLVLEPREHPLARDLGHDLLDPAEIALARGQDLAAPALQIGVALVHAQEVAREQRRLVAAGAGADLQDRVLVVGRVLGQQQQPHLPLQLGQASRELALLRLHQIRHVGIARHRAELAQFALDRPVGLDGRHHRAEVGKFLGELGVAAGRDLGEQRLQLVAAGEDGVELGL